VLDLAITEPVNILKLHPVNPVEN